MFQTKTPEQFTIDDSQPGPQLSFPSKQDLGDVWGVLKSHSHVELGQAKIYIQFRNLLLWSFSVQMSHGELCGIITKDNMWETNVHLFIPC